jgi:hypothetical protein
VPELIIFSLNTLRRVSQEKTSKIGFKREKGKGEAFLYAKRAKKATRAPLFKASQKREETKRNNQFSLPRLMNNNSSICVALRGRLQSNTATALLYIS